VNTVITPRNPAAPSPDDDPTGVRALLSGLPEPDPMPAYLVERISASLAAEQAQRAVTFSDASVTPLLDRRRRRSGRLLFALAGAAAAVALIGIVGTNLFRTNATSTASDSAAAAITPGARAAEGVVPPSVSSPSANDKAAAGRSTPAVIQFRLSETRYTRAAFATQASNLRTAQLDQLDRIQPGATYSASVGRIGTTAGLADCLAAVGAGRAQAVRADLAYYEGRPAVIIVATTDGIPTAYVVGRSCSGANATLLHPATRLP